MFYEYRQNNSGGHFVVDHERGISVDVIIEADSGSEADRIAEDIGLYFDGFGDCPCCGDRWSAQEGWYSGKGDEVPSLYGDPIDIENGSPSFKWAEGLEGYIHYKDGSVVGFWG